MIPQIYKDDFYQATSRLFQLRRDWYLALRSYLFWGRMRESSHGKGVRWLAGWIMRQMAKRNGNEITFNGSIGGGLVLAHGRNITVNSKAKLGRNCVLFKGCTIGSVRSGKRAGWPVLGDRVVVGCNAFVCGGIRIGDDVLIAANAFVNFDVPDHSVVVGNPGVIHHKDHATADYIHDPMKMV